MHGQHYVTSHRFEFLQIHRNACNAKRIKATDELLILSRRATSKMLSCIGASVVLLLISSDLTFALQVRSCSSKKPLPLSVEVDGCEKEPCKAVNKRNIHFAINFEVRKYIQQLSHRIHILL